MKKETKLDKLIKFIKGRHFYKLVLLIFLVGLMYSGWECKTKYFDFKKPQIKIEKIK